MSAISHSTHPNGGLDYGLATAEVVVPPAPDYAAESRVLGINPPRGGSLLRAFTQILQSAASALEADVPDHTPV